MKICIIGAGVVGSFLARKLSAENHDVAVIDIDREKLEAISYSTDVACFGCNALEVNCLKNVKDFELFIVVTDSDEKNIAISLLLKALLGKDKIVLRTNSKAFASPPVKKLLGSNVVNILSETIQSVVLQVKYPFVKSAVRLEREGILVFSYGIKTEDTIAGKQIAELKDLRDKVDFTIVAVNREGKVIIPDGSTFLYPDDLVYVAVKERDALKFAELFGISQKPTETVFVFGRSEFSEELLAKLSDMNVKVKFFSHLRKDCDEIAEKFPGVSVIFSEFTDSETLLHEGIENADLSVVMSKDEEVNILTGVLLKKIGSKRVCTIIENPEYEKIAESIGIDNVIIPRKLLASKVYREISLRGVLELLEFGGIDIFELEVSKKLAGKTVYEIRKDLKGVVAFIRKEKEIKIARGSTILDEGDVLICVRKNEP